MSIRKITQTISNDVVTEHPGKGFNEVYSEVKGTDTNIVLVRYDEDNSGIGYVYTSEALIGNAKDNLTQGDYWAAYDKII